MNNSFGLCGRSFPNLCRSWVAPTSGGLVQISPLQPVLGTHPGGQARVECLRRQGGEMRQAPALPFPSLPFPASFIQWLGCRVLFPSVVPSPG